MSIGPAIAGLLADRSMLLLFIGGAATSAAFGWVALVALPEGVRASREAARIGALRHMLRRAAQVERM